MADKLANLEPKNLWKYFESISGIPRESGNETRAVDYLENLAKEKKLTYKRDSAGNIVMQIPASAGYEKSPKIILQGHVDMVCVKSPESGHDFAQDGIDLIIDGDWLTANKTTLGADNGIGVSAALAIIDEPSLVHPPIEILVTVDEEVGMTGAGKLSPDMLSGKILINLDSMDLGHFYIGCAGGGDCVVYCPIERTPAIPGIHMRLRVSGLTGGHSGLEIHRNSANSNKLLARILYRTLNLGIGFSHIKGGTKRNVIPSETIAYIIVPEHQLAEFRKIMDEEINLAKDEYSSTDPNMKYQLDNLSDIGEKPLEDIINPQMASAIINLLIALPNGVLAMSKEVENLVETSNNMGVINTLENKIQIICTHRSSVKASKLAVRNQITAAALLAGAQIDVEHDYPGWKPNLESRILQIVKKTYSEKFGAEGIAEAKHAGLETGLLLEKIPGLDVISFGPDIRDAHSVDERVNIKTVNSFYELLKGVIEKVAKEY